jgi:hypothetical protein
MGNPYSEFTIENFKNEDLIHEVMSDYVMEIANGSGDWAWTDFQKYIDMQSEFIDERLQELSCCGCNNERCGVDGACEKKIELDEQVHQLYKDLNI